MNVAELAGPEDLGPLMVIAGAVLLIGVTFVATRVARSLRHGFSIRLQIFIALVVGNLVVMGAYGLLIFERLHSKAQTIMALHPSMSSAIEALLANFGPPLAFLSIVLGVASAAAAFIVGRHLARPLEQITRAAESVAQGDRTAPFPMASGREPRQLIAALDSMRRALEQRHAMEQFVADLSHELKNPVAAIRAASEVLDEGAAEDPEARPRFLKRIQEANHRLDVLVQDLLALARLEARGISDEVELVDLEALIRTAVEGAAGRLESRGVSVTLQTRSVKVHGSPRWISRALDNLLSNAIRYSPEGGVITVSLTSEGGVACMTVADEGPGVTPALRGRLFERFVTERAEQGGSGLGLAIVQTVAAHHLGEARLAPSEKGARFELTLAL
ncbi:MAG: ATP-binding protein [Bradymonadia bacterium]